MQHNEPNEEGTYMENRFWNLDWNRLYDALKINKKKPLLNGLATTPEILIVSPRVPDKFVYC